MLLDYEYVFGWLDDKYVFNIYIFSQFFTDIMNILWLCWLIKSFIFYIIADLWRDLSDQDDCSTVDI